MNGTAVSYVLFSYLRTKLLCYVSIDNSEESRLSILNNLSMPTIHTDAAPTHMSIAESNNKMVIYTATDVTGILLSFETIIKPTAPVAE